jgi:hypothetical protein
MFSCWVFILYITSLLAAFFFYPDVCYCCFIKKKLNVQLLGFISQCLNVPRKEITVVAVATAVADPLNVAGCNLGAAIASRLQLWGNLKIFFDFDNFKIFLKPKFIYPY